MMFIFNFWFCWATFSGKRAWPPCASLLAWCFQIRTTIGPLGGPFGWMLSWNHVFKIFVLYISKCRSFRDLDNFCCPIKELDNATLMDRAFNADVYKHEWFSRWVSHQAVQTICKPCYESSHYHPQESRKSRCFVLLLNNSSKTTTFATVFRVSFEMTVMGLQVTWHPTASLYDFLILDFTEFFTVCDIHYSLSHLQLFILNIVIDDSTLKLDNVPLVCRDINSLIIIIKWCCLSIFWRA